MKWSASLILASVVTLAFSDAHADRIDEPNPGDSEDPVIDLTIAEEEGNVTLTFRVPRTYHGDYILRRALLCETDESDGKDLTHRKGRNQEYEVRFAISKDKINEAHLFLDYRDPTHNPEQTGGANGVVIKLSKYYKHYTARNIDFFVAFQSKYGEGYYKESPVDDPPGPKSGDARVLRGFSGAAW